MNGCFLEQQPYSIYFFPHRIYSNKPYNYVFYILLTKTFLFIKIPRKKRKSNIRFIAATDQGGSKDCVPLTASDLLVD